MKNRAAALLLALAISVFVCSCGEQQSEYAMRPEDKTLFYETSDDYKITSTDATSGNAGAAASPAIVNSTAFAMTDGSTYYLDGEKLYYKSYYSEKYLVDDSHGIKSIFYLVGTCCAWDGEGTLYSVTSENKLAPIIKDVGGGARFLSSGTNLYAAAQNGLYRLQYAANPELVTASGDYPALITEDGDGVYYAANGKIYYLKHLDVFPREIVGSGILGVIATTGTPDAERVACLGSNGNVVVVSLPGGEATDTGIVYDGALRDFEIKLWPARSKSPSALTVGTSYYVFDGNKTGTLPGDSGECLSFDGRYFYLASGGTFTVYDVDTPGQAESSELLGGVPYCVYTPTRCYLVSGSESDTPDYGTSIYDLRDGKANLVSGGVYSNCTPCAGYGYYGLYYITEKGLMVYDDETQTSDCLMEPVSPLADVATRMSGVYALYQSGRLDLLKQGESVSVPVEESGVTSLVGTGYDAASLRVFPQ